MDIHTGDIVRDERDFNFVRQVCVVCVSHVHRACGVFCWNEEEMAAHDLRRPQRRLACDFIVEVRQLPVGGMIWRSKALVLDWAVPLGFGVVLCLTVPLRTGLEFGADEGYELMKAFLVSLGHPLYYEVWNDQPPLHTELLALLFRVFGPSAYVGRLLSVGFAMVLVGSLYKVSSNRSRRVAGLVALALLVSRS